MPATSSSQFAETRWSLVRRAGGGSCEEVTAALSELCGLYHAPVERFVRLWCGDAEKARDLTQEFFLAVLQRQNLGGADAERGRFRSYLLGAVKHFLSDAADRAQTLRRGGGIEHVPLQPQAAGEDVDASHECPSDFLDIKATPPDVEFDRQWAFAVLGQALDSLEQEMAAEGRAPQFAVLKPWLAGQDATPGQTLAAHAAELGVTESAVRVALHRLRQRFREAVRQQVAQTLNAPSDLAVEEELRHLRATLLG